MPGRVSQRPARRLPSHQFTLRYFHPVLSDISRVIVGLGKSYSSTCLCTAAQSQLLAAENIDEFSLIHPQLP